MHNTLIVRALIAAEWFLLLVIFVLLDKGI